MCEEDAAKHMLRTFLSELNSAVYNHLQGNETPEWFTHYAGICGNLADWALETESRKARYHMMQRNLLGMFRKAGLNPLYPFNTGGSNFAEEISHGDIWNNEQRLQWLADHS